MKLMSRQPIVVANWKMNKLPSEAEGYIQEVAPKLAKYPNVDTVLAGQDVLLNAMVSAAKGTSVCIGAENVYWEDRGAYTGETSPAALADLGIQVVIIGHSERRNYFRETDEMVNLKTLAALRNGLMPIIAIDEAVQLESENDHAHWIVNQVVESLKGVAIADLGRVMLAYEPTAAIGSGQAMGPEIAQKSLRIIRQTVADMFGQPAADQMRILYGGSVKPTNAYELLAQPDIDGVLVGDAALDAMTFIELVSLADQAKRSLQKEA
ncbi:triose-phosphate isomerase [Weissella cibaria]|uniref:Triosephosphate isomerase n=2 Tax=Lactobacillaceae TaxID=33958 RepID=A0A1X4JMK7_9LACO|nr:triose-phosphate isomerase [Weissella cibaria]MBD1502635.1 triose-phosphate isomerase [Weissella cibaria]MCS8562618.1 triose-phosphate isomerase [Weissella cibaria]MCS8565958.1 triose-phosphate isomerase [Weissella cibaria]MCS8577023.1 triose-phosphate isomerase [Weissella cibaria]